MENMFEKGCLVQLFISKWGGVKKINDNQLAEMIETHEWLTATKKLVDPESLKPICKVGNSARTYLTSISLPFPIQGMVFIPKEMITRVDQKLEEFKTEFSQTVASFLQDYDKLRETAMVYLGELFNEIDYPVHVEEKFSFTWRFIILDVPNGKSGILSPEVYEREKEKFIQTMEEARTMAIESLLMSLLMKPGLYRKVRVSMMLESRWMPQRTGDRMIMISALSAATRMAATSTSWRSAAMAFTASSKYRTAI